MNVQHLPLPVVYLPQHVNQNEIFLAGFRDCSQEAVRFLVEEEKLSPQDPIIAGLQDYLRRKEDVIDVSQHVQQHVVQHVGPQVQQFVQNQEYYNYLPTFNPYHMDYNHVTLANSKPVQQVEPPVQQLHDVSLTSNDSGFTLDTSMTSSMCDDDVFDDCDKDSGVSVSEDELAEGAMELNELAQNNPNINKLLTELFELFDDESDDDDDFDEEMDL